MLGENNVKRGQIRGWLFESVLRILLGKSGFDMVRPCAENAGRVRMLRRDFVEIKGRGDWHQIDLPFDYSGNVPFLYPVRLLGEVKYLQSEVPKEQIRNFIGTMKDIQENYFVDSSLSGEMVKGRRMELGAFFAANGFSEPSERLAYAHGIRTISYRNNKVIAEIAGEIAVLEKDYLRYFLFSTAGTRYFPADFKEALEDGGDCRELAEQWGLEDGAVKEMLRLKNSISGIRTSFFASTDTGVVTHFLGTAPFPAKLFQQRDEAPARVSYSRVENENRYYLTFNEDSDKRRFYFSPPKTFSKAALYGTDTAAKRREGERDSYRLLSASMKLNNVQRSLKIRMEQDWLDAGKELKMFEE